MAKQAIKVLQEKYEEEYKTIYSNEVARDAYTKKHQYRRTKMDYNDANGIVRIGVKTPINNLTQWC